MKPIYILVLAGVALFACSAQPELRPATAVPELGWAEVDTADGKTLYGDLCASCHGPEARGDGPVAEALAVATPDLTRLSERNGGRYPLRRVESAIRGPELLEIHGSPRMPLWGPALEGVFDDLPRVNREAFAAHRIRLLSRYLESLQVEGS